jgi:hypothetical protein
MDTALNDFIKRMGDNDPNKIKSQDPITPINYMENNFQKESDLERSAKFGKAALKTGSGLLAKKVDTPEGMTPADSVDGNTTKIEGDVQEGPDVAGALEGVSHGMKLVDNIKGGQFDTSADGGGPGKAGGAIVSGATTGMQFADSIGLKDPLSKGIAAVTGGLISTFAHSSAQKKYQKNQVTANLKENALQKAQSEEAYAMSEGEESKGLLKGLYQKQLGIQTG